MATPSIPSIAGYVPQGLAAYLTVFRSVLNPCTSWLIKTARDGLVECIREVTNASLRRGVVVPVLKETVITAFLKGGIPEPYYVRKSLASHQSSVPENSVRAYCYLSVPGVLGRGPILI